MPQTHGEESHTMFLYNRTHLGEELDVVADPDEVHPPVEPEDVQPAPRAAGVEDDGVPPRPSRRVLPGRWLLGDADLPAKRGRVCLGHDGVVRRGQLQEEKQHSCRADDTSHCC